MSARRVEHPVRRLAKRGFRGYPVGTVAFYGPDNTRATKAAVGIVLSENAQPAELERWTVEQGDVRRDISIGKEVVAFLKQHGTKSVVMVDRIIGCPHEEGIDYSDGEACPDCPFWRDRDRWTGDPNPPPD